MGEAAYTGSEPTLALGDVLRDTSRLYRGLFWRNVLTAFLVFAVVCLVQSVGPWPVVLLSFVGTALVQGALVEAVAHERERRPRRSIAALYRSAGRRLGALVGVALLTGAGVGVGLLLLVVPGLVLFTRWSLAVPAVMIEGRSPRSALRRSAELVRGHGWAVFAVFFAVTVAAGLASLVIELALAGAVGLWASLTLASALTTPFAAHALNVVYYRIVDPGQPLLQD
ncbi:MAG: glycerophosphoryl diester phosphodiesterase membrane domain-containing protein [Gaiellaceae bacterium]